jgi:hypothetical protein
LFLLRVARFCKNIDSAELYLKRNYGWQINHRGGILASNIATVCRFAFWRSQALQKSKNSQHRENRVNRDFKAKGIFLAFTVCSVFSVLNLSGSVSLKQPLMMIATPLCTSSRYLTAFSA